MLGRQKEREGKLFSRPETTAAKGWGSTCAWDPTAMACAAAGDGQKAETRITAPPHTDLLTSQESLALRGSRPAFPDCSPLSSKQPTWTQPRRLTASERRAEHSAGQGADASTETDHTGASLQVSRETTAAAARAVRQPPRPVTIPCELRREVRPAGSGCQGLTEPHFQRESRSKTQHSGISCARTRRDVR